MKILACTDGSEHSRKALEEAANLARGVQGAEISVIYVSVPPDIDGIIPDEVNKRMEERKSAVMENAEKVFADQNLQINTILREGHPAEEIIRVAREGQYDIVVIADKGRWGGYPKRLGSVSNAVAQETRSNVFIVKQ